VKKTAVAFALIIFSMAIFLPFSLNNQAANAQTSGYSIQSVSQNTQILNSGQMVITDNIQLSGQMPGSFELGLPYKYGANLLKGAAYDSNYNPLTVTFGVQLQGQSGFYGAQVNLPSGTSSSFTVVFIVSSAVLTPSSNGYILDFPAYTGFTQTVANYSASVNLPSGASVVSIVKPDGSQTTNTYAATNLAAFTYAPATAVLSAGQGVIPQVTLSSLTREVSISPSGSITSTDTYKLANNGTGSISYFLFNLPVNSKNIVARDQFGRVLSTTVTENSAQVLVENVTLAVAMEAGQASVVSFDYSLPSVTPQSSRYVLNLDLFPSFNYYVESASVTIVPPEGATIVVPQLSQVGESADLSRSVFQETLTINKQGVSSIDSVIPSEDIVHITFDYNPLWIAFRPTSWMWAIVLVGVVVIALWTRPRTKAAPAAARISTARASAGAALSPEHIKDFVEAYEEKAKINQELRALEARVQHGRIPRRRYKVQRQTLEARLETLSHSTANLKEILRGSGGIYADTVKQLEAADVEINEVELSLQGIEVRHESGEMPMDAYRKQLVDLERRKEKAEGTINGLLLRLRGEIR
jgi:hypothetical protein